MLAEFPDKRPFKPSKTVLRLLAYAWGEETDDWPESPRLTLYRDEKVKWAGQEIGGIRVSHMSHIEKPLKVALAESKGKKSLHARRPAARRRTRLAPGLRGDRQPHCNAARRVARRQPRAT